jgi:hypothetical protein
MPSVYAVLTHLSAVTFGVLTGYVLARRGKVSPPTEGTHMPWSTKQGRRLLLIIAVLAASFVVIGLGVQQVLYQKALENQREEDKRDADRDAALVGCLQDWGDDIVSTIQNRSAATAGLDRAQTRLDKAVRRERASTAAVLLTVGGLRQVPPTASLADLDTVLNQFPMIRARVDAAQQAVDQAQAESDATRALNPYQPPRLACSEGDVD